MQVARQCQDVTLTEPPWQRTREDRGGLWERRTRTGGETVKQKPNHQPGTQKGSHGRYTLRKLDGNKVKSKIKRVR